MIDCSFVRYLGLVGLCALTACSVFPDQLTPRKGSSGGTGGASGGTSGLGAMGGEGGTAGSAQGGSGAGGSGGSSAGASGAAGAAGGSAGAGGSTGGSAGVGGAAGSAGTGGSAGVGGSAGSGGSGGVLTCPTLAPNASFELVGSMNHPSGWQVIYEQGTGLIWESTDVDHRKGSRSLLIDTQAISGNPYYAGIGTNQISIDAGATLEVTFSARIVKQGGGQPALSFDYFTNGFVFISGDTIANMPENDAWVEYGPLTVVAPSNASRLTLNIDFDDNARFFMDDICFRIVQ